MLTWCARLVSSSSLPPPFPFPSRTLFLPALSQLAPCLIVEQEQPDYGDDGIEVAEKKKSKGLLSGFFGKSKDHKDKEHPHRDEKEREHRDYKDKERKSQEKMSQFSFSSFLHLAPHADV